MEIDGDERQLNNERVSETETPTLTSPKMRNWDRKYRDEEKESLL